MKNIHLTTVLQASKHGSGASGVGLRWAAELPFCFLLLAALALAWFA